MNNKNWIELDPKEIDIIINNNLQITDHRLRDAVYGVVLDVMFAVMEKNGFGDEVEET